MAEFNANDYHILVVEDTDVVLRLIESTLSMAGFQVSTAYSGEDALTLVRRNGLPNLALVDINLPFGMDGFEFAETVHEYSDLPVIMVTGIEDESTIIDAMEHHAEDYIVKPFNTGELVARVRRVLRSSIGQFPFKLAQPTPIDAHLQIDFPHRRLFANDVADPVPLTDTETKLLYILMRSPGRVLTYDFLLRRLWPHEQVFEDRLRVNVHRLRQKMGAANADTNYIKSQRGRGYLFMPMDTN